MFNSSFDAVVPMLCVTLAALATMLSEAFRGKGERTPIGGLGIIGLVGAGISAAFLWNVNAASFGVLVADNFALFVTMTLVIVGRLSSQFSATLEEHNRAVNKYIRGR